MDSLGMKMLAKVARKRGYKYRNTGDYGYRTRKEVANCYNNRIQLYNADNKTKTITLLIFKNNKLEKQEKISYHDFFQETGMNVKELI